MATVVTLPPSNLAAELTDWTIAFGSSYELAGFAYLPRRGGGNGTIGKYECYVGDNSKELGKPVIAGTFAQPNAENVVQFPAKQKGRYLLLRALTVALRDRTSRMFLKEVTQSLPKDMLADMGYGVFAGRKGE